MYTYISIHNVILYYIHQLYRQVSCFPYYSFTQSCRQKVKSIYICGEKNVVNTNHVIKVLESKNR